MRRNDVVLTSFRRHVPTRFIINHFQIITFLIFKSDIKENSRIEMRGIVLPVPSNQISYIYYYFTFQLGTFVFFPVAHRNLRKMGWIIGGPKGMLAPLSQIIWGEGGRACPPPPPLPPPPPPPFPTPMNRRVGCIKIGNRRLLFAST